MEHIAPLKKKARQGESLKPYGLFSVNNTIYMRKLIFSSAIFFLLSYCVQAQQQKNNKINTGLELDVLPFTTGGWFASVWVGKNQWRLRILTVKVYKPDFTTRKGFSNHQIKAYAIVTDHFLNHNWKGVWLGGGLVLWNSSIQTTAKLQTTTFTNYLINGSAGCNIMLFKHLYISPWGGVSIRTGGNTNLKVDDKLYTLPFLNPEASLKLGIYF